VSPLPDSDSVVAIIRETAERDIMPRFQRLRRHEVMEKKAGEVVTIADIEAEHRLSQRLPELVPGSQVVGEEAVAKDPAVLGRLTAGGPAWLVDPVDGTGNFAAGSPVFAIIVCFLVDGRSRAGWIHDPISGRTAIAYEGEGAWYDGERLSASPRVALDAMTGSLNYSYFPHDMREPVRRRAREFRKLYTYRCAAHDYLSLARGDKHFSLYRRLWPWDHAAGVLLLQEAGGYTARLDDMAYRAADRVEGLLSTTDPDSWTAIKNFLCEA
jgi:fructose-1,6-bisphosphatase/inositol monophosphatase family enzyme